MLQIFKMLRLSWDERFLTASKATLVSRRRYATGADTVVFELNTPLLPGWYMIEIEIDAGLARIPADIVLSAMSGDAPARLKLPLYPSRCGKRIVRVAGGIRRLEIALPISRGAFDFPHFRLARLTGQFAASRMRKRLESSHPLYKNELHHERKSAGIARIWGDYCAIFDDASPLIAYDLWLRQCGSTTETKFAGFDEANVRTTDDPWISVILPISTAQAPCIDRTIDSLLAQTYANWELCLAHAEPLSDIVRTCIDALRRTRHPVRVVDLPTGASQAALAAAALGVAQGDWVMLVAPNDQLDASAFSCVARVVIEHRAALVYSDEDSIDQAGTRFAPFFKPDWSIDTFHSSNFVGGLCVFQTARLRDVGGFRAAANTAFEYDAILRYTETIDSAQIRHVPRVLYHRWYPQSGSHWASTNLRRHEAEAVALNDHFQRLRVDGLAEATPHGVRTTYRLRTHPLVTIIIPTRNRADLLRTCIESICAKTSYSRFEILVVDNDSDEADSLHYLDDLQRRGTARVRKHAGAFNYSAINNEAVALARGSVIALLNNDIEVIAPDWLTEMVSHAVRPDIGAVGAKLLYPDGSVQHAGIVLGIHGIAGHAHRFLHCDAPGYFGIAQLTHSRSAVTAACIVMRKTVFEQVEGFNADVLPVTCNDVDLCLKLVEAGYRNLLTPYALMYHHESASRGSDDRPEKIARARREIAYMQRRWTALLTSDPSYNPNLGLDDEYYNLAYPPRPLSI